jgi:hypothetical protein
MSEQTLEVPKYTGDRDHWRELEQQFNAALEAATPDGKAIALGIRTGLAELAVDVSAMRAFGTGGRRGNQS